MQIRLSSHYMLQSLIKAEELKFRTSLQGTLNCQLHPLIMAVDCRQERRKFVGQVYLHLQEMSLSTCDTLIHTFSTHQCLKQPIDGQVIGNNELLCAIFFLFPSIKVVHTLNIHVYIVVQHFVSSSTKNWQHNYVFIKGILSL